MPSHRQPKTLESLSLGRVCQQVNGVCQDLLMLSHKVPAMQVLAFAKQTIRPYYINVLHSHLSSKVLNETMKIMFVPPNEEESIYSSPQAIPFLLVLLLNHGIRDLKVGLCCYYGCSHQTSLLKLIASEGVGLRSLELTRSALLRLDFKLLYSALLNIRNLTSLTLRNIANDVILLIIGKTCPKLAILDVACSRQVTNLGLKKLLLEMMIRDKPHFKSPQEHTRTWLRIKKLFTMVKRNKSQEMDNQNIILEYYENKNPLCDTLRVLNIGNTSITTAGVSFALANIPQLKSLGEYSYIERVMEVISTGHFDSSKIPFSLTQARSCKMTLKNLELLAQLCPKIEKLHISELHHSPKALALFPHITFISIHNVPMKKKWLNDFYNYLQSNGRNLYYLNFQMQQSRNPLEIDLRLILNSCPNLRVLILGEANITWTDGCDPTALSYLKIIQLGHTTSALVIMKILSLTPELQTLHVYSCPDLTNRHLETFRPPERIQSQRMFDICDNSSSNLTCFYIHEMRAVSAVTVLSIFNNYKQLKQLGNVINWGLNIEDLKKLRKTLACTNVDANFCSNSHWFWNNCIPILQQHHDQSW